MAPTDCAAKEPPPDPQATGLFWGGGAGLKAFVASEELQSRGRQ
jgi:hypothetical protein